MLRTEVGQLGDGEFELPIVSVPRYWEQWMTKTGMM